MFSIELIPDPALEQAVRAQWEALEAADLPSLARHTSETNRPHVTAIVRRTLPGGLDLTEIAALLPMPVALGGLQLFAATEGRVVVARQVVATDFLLALQKRLRRLVGPGEPDLVVTEPGAWTPHMTLARKMRPEQLASALPLLDITPVIGRFEGLRIWDGDAKTVTVVR